MKELSHLKRLSSVRSNAGVKFLTPAAFPGNHCPMHTALALGSRIRGMSTLVVGTSECGNYSRKVIAAPESREAALHWMYVLDAREAVFGCREGVMEALREMDRAGAEAILVIATCVPEVIGEDMEGMLCELRPQIGADVNFVGMGHFTCNSYPSGFWKTLEAIGGMLREKPTDPKRVNVLGRSPNEEHIPMPELLTEIENKGYSLRFLAPHSDWKDFVGAPDARLNLVLSPYMYALAETMEREFQIPYERLYETFSIADTDEQYRRVGDALGLSWGDAFSESRRQALALQEQGGERMRGMRYLVTHRCGLPPLSLALYLRQWEAEPILLHIEEFYPQDRKRAKAFRPHGPNPYLCHMVNEPADAVVLETLDADLSFGEIPAGTGKIRCVPHLLALYGRIGYERTAAFWKITLAALSEPSKEEKQYGIA